MAGKPQKGVGILNREKTIMNQVGFRAIRNSLFALSLLTFASSALAGPLDEMSLDRWKLLRENEIYQLQIAEKYFREQNWKVALPEYEKFLTLYEKS